LYSRNAFTPKINNIWIIKFNLIKKVRAYLSFLPLCGCVFWILKHFWMKITFLLLINLRLLMNSVSLPITLSSNEVLILLKSTSFTSRMGFLVSLTVRLLCWNLHPSHLGWVFCQSHYKTSHSSISHQKNYYRRIRWMISYPSMGLQNVSSSSSRSCLTIDNSRFRVLDP
jgi:hypothetical protein